MVMTFRYMTYAGRIEEERRGFRSEDLRCYGAHAKREVAPVSHHLRFQVLDCAFLRSPLDFLPE